MGSSSSSSTSSTVGRDDPGAAMPGPANELRGVGALSTPVADEEVGMAWEEDMADGEGERAKGGRRGVKTREMKGPSS